MPFAAAERLIPGRYIQSAISADTPSGTPCPAAIAVVLNARTMKPAGGLTGSRINCCRHLILWLPLHCPVLSGLWPGIHQKEIYPFLFSCASSTLKDFALNPKKLGVKAGMTIVLHTNTRNLDYHPHVHVLIPAGGVDKKSKHWKKKKGKYLFKKDALARVFRARFLHELNNAGFSIPKNTPKKWIAHCKHIGTGLSAIKYLARYLYRGIISEKNIIANRDGKVTFKYIDNNKVTQYRTLNGEDFIKLILQHVLPKGFRRVRDYGFLHSNAKKIRHLIQVVLRVVIDKMPIRPRPLFECKLCKSQMTIVKFRKPVRGSG